MTEELRNARTPFSFEEAMEELGLIRAEFIDLVRWAELAVITPIPTGTTASLFYNYQVLSSVPPTYPSIAFTSQVDYLHINSSILSKIALGGKQRLSRFELITFSSGKTFSANQLHRKIYAQAMEIAKTQTLSTWEEKKFGMEFNNIMASANCEKWFSIKKSNTIDFRPQFIAEPTWAASLDFENPKINQIEYVDVKKSDVLFFPEMIYELKKLVVALSKQQAGHIELSQIGILNKAASLYESEISKINNFRDYWDNNKDTSRLINYLSAALKRPKDRTLKNCIQVLINDEILFSDELPEIKPRKTKYPEHYSDALTRLNEAGDPEVLASMNMDLSHSERLKNSLMRLGFKDGAATHLKVIINGL